MLLSCASAWPPPLFPRAETDGERETAGVFSFDSLLVDALGGILGGLLSALFAAVCRCDCCWNGVRASTWLDLM